jgi:hypothetical protein
MKTESNERGAKAEDHPADRLRAATHDHPWGLRGSYNLIKKVVTATHELGSASTEKIATHSGLKNTGVELALVTLSHLGYVRRSAGRATLTADGEAFANSIGSSTESEILRRALFGHPGFRRIWQRVAEEYQEVGRHEIVMLLKEQYQYNDLTTEHSASVCLSYARAANLCTPVGKSNRYAVDRSKGPTTLPVGGERELRTAEGRSVKSDNGQASLKEERAVRNLLELTARLAWPLADSTALSDRLVRETVLRAFDRAIADSEGARWATLLKLADEMATRSFERNDRDAIRWAVICLRGALQVMEASPQLR